MGSLLLKVLGFSGNQHPIDPTQFNDPLALKTAWTPASRGGSNFRTHRFIEDEVSRAEFRAATAAKVFYSFFSLVGLVFASATLFGIASTADRSDLGAWMPVFIGTLFLVIGGGMWYQGTVPIVFDKGVGYFWKGRKGPQDVSDIATLKRCAPIDQIHALQLVSEFVRTGKSSYYSYELNLVLEDARRLTVVDHGNLNRLREDAGKLSQFLGKPVWDAIDMTR